IVEGQDAIGVAAVRDRFIARLDLEARRTLVDKEACDALLELAADLLFTRARKEDHEIGGVRMADEVFGPVDDPVSAVLASYAPHATNVGPRIRFRDRQRVRLLAANTRCQIARSLV